MPGSEHWYLAIISRTFLNQPIKRRGKDDRERIIASMHW